MPTQHHPCPDPTSGHNDANCKTTIETTLFHAGWYLLGAVGLLLLLKQLLIPDLILVKYMRPCVLYSLTGYYCPGCGGTRSVIALLHGQFLICALDYPLVAYTVLMFAAFMLTQSMELLSRGTLAIGMRWHNAYLWIALFILAAHFILKNIYFMLTGLPPFIG